MTSQKLLDIFKQNDNISSSADAYRPYLMFIGHFRIRPSVVDISVVDIAEAEDRDFMLSSGFVSEGYGLLLITNGQIQDSLYNIFDELHPPRP
jgi:hypothetical protein